MSSLTDGRRPSRAGHRAVSPPMRLWSGPVQRTRRGPGRWHASALRCRNVQGQFMDVYANGRRAIDPCGARRLVSGHRELHSAHRGPRRRTYSSGDTARLEERGAGEFPVLGARRAGASCRGVPSAAGCYIVGPDIANRLWENMTELRSAQLRDGCPDTAAREATAERVRRIRRPVWKRSGTIHEGKSVSFVVCPP